MLPVFLMGSAILAVTTMVGYEILPKLSEPVAQIRLEPAIASAELDQLLEVRIIVDSSVPVNVFGGELHFNKDVLAVDGISYNTSIADLWAIRPWYSNGDGTLNFGGGTTKRGGFTGSDVLLTVTFKTIGSGVGTVSMDNIQIHLNDGLGTKAAIGEPIDALLTVAPPQQTSDPHTRLLYAVSTKLPSTDLNNDGAQGIADLEYLMLNATTQNKRADLNADGHVDTKDLSILLGAK